MGAHFLGGLGLAEQLMVPCRRRVLLADVGPGDLVVVGRVPVAVDALVLLLCLQDGVVLVELLLNVCVCARACVCAHTHT